MAAMRTFRGSKSLAGVVGDLSWRKDASGAFGLWVLQPDGWKRVDARDVEAHVLMSQEETALRRAMSKRRKEARWEP